MKSNIQEEAAKSIWLSLFGQTELTNLGVAFYHANSLIGDNLPGLSRVSGINEPMLWFAIVGYGLLEMAGLEYKDSLEDYTQEEQQTVIELGKKLDRQAITNGPSVIFALIRSASAYLIDGLSYHKEREDKMKEEQRKADEFNQAMESIQQERYSL